MDAIYGYSVEDEIVNDLTTLGLDPKVTYVIISHAHDDHVGGARFLQGRRHRWAEAHARRHHRHHVPDARAHPYVIGKDAVQRFFTVAEECGQAGVATAP